MNIFNHIQPKSVEIVLTSVPWTITHIPLMAVPVLKSVALQNNRTCVGLDLNAVVLNWSEQHPFKNKLLDFFHNETYHPELTEDLFSLYYNFAQVLLAHKPKTIGLSLFSYVSQISTRYICYFLKKLAPNVEIIIGGPGCFENLRGNSSFADELLDNGLIDYYIRGDGEKSFQAFLQGDFNYPGINKSDWVELSKQEIETLPVPDYDDYDFSQYKMQAVPVLGSRGCIRRCKFCDIIEYWKKYNYRSGESIYQEMLIQNQRYGIRTFKFQDSLINGNLKEYKILIKLLAEHNQRFPDNSFTWSSYFIFRPESTFGEEWWALTAASGAQWLSVGVESLAEHVRYHMGKHFSNQDIEFSLQMAKKYNIKLFMLLIVGYVTETEEDIKFAAEWWRTHTEYKDLMKIQLGGTLGIFPNTYLDRNKEELKIITFGPPYQKWNNTVTGSTPERRAHWQQYLFKTCQQLGYDMVDDIDNHYVLELLMHGKT
jgi:hypothetical protein